VQAPFLTRADLRADLEGLGLRPGDVVLAHGALSRVGRLLNGPDAVIGALLDAVSPGGTVLAYTDWDARYDELTDDGGRVPDRWRPHVPPFVAEASRAARDNGALPEFLRTWPGARRSGNPGASVAALGARAEWFTADHPLDYGYGRGSPLAKLVEAGGKVVMIGAPLDTMTLLHHAEHLADLPGKRVIRYEVPLATGDGVEWRTVEEFDTAEPVVAGFADDYFATVVEAFLASGRGARGRIGAAESVLVDATEICSFAVRWMERHRPARPADDGNPEGVVVRLPTSLVARYRAVDREIIGSPVVDTPAHLDALTASVREHGIRVPLRLGFNAGFGFLDGNHRIAAALRLGLADVPVELVEEPADLRKYHGRAMRADDLAVLVAALEQNGGGATRPGRR